MNLGLSQRRAPIDYSSHRNHLVPSSLHLERTHCMPRPSRFGLLLALLIVPIVGLPRSAAASPPPPQAMYFDETGHSAQNWYWNFWKNTPEGLRILGYPISEPFVQESFTEPGKSYRVQYFERAVLEEHPQNFNKDGNDFYVLGRLLGTEMARGRENEPAFQPVPSIPTTPDQIWLDRKSVV